MTTQPPISPLSPSIPTLDPPSPAPPPQRLSLPLPLRLPLSLTFTILTGLTLGAPLAARSAGLRFRAENAHRLPTNQTGWYLYHKSKNYHMALAGIRGGLGLGVRMAAPVGGFFVVEEAVDRARGARDFGSTVIAALSVAGGWSLWNRFPLPTAARTAKMALTMGAGFGLFQDAIALARGHSVGYVDFLLGRKRRRREGREVGDELRASVS
ncbi:MAG: hypothetical protein M1833_002162 [Piccolia ochrophora]|nr:MAG: hypothetical protein M1833_002162 [Piccolia ochrophora]